MARDKLNLTDRAVIALIVVLTPIIIPVATAILFALMLYPIVLYGLIWLLWLPRGKDVLLIYSDSPIWQDYMTTQIIPLVKDRAVILNWSERHNWSEWSFSVQVFRYFGGTNEFNPMVAVFQPFRRARLFRFWSAFKEWKRGDKEPVTRLRLELLQSL
jgi:hypothetical protein